MGVAMTYKTKEYVDYALASISSRFLAAIIDGLILGAITGILVGSSRNAGGLGASFAIGMLYHWYFLTRKNGQTIGSLIMKIRVVKSTGEPLTDVDAILRYVIGATISSWVFGLGYFWALWDDKRQTWHDKVVSTYVVQAETGY